MRRIKMNKMFTVLASLMVAAVVSGLVYAQSDYSTRTGYSIAKAPQSTMASIEHRQGMIVGHYVYDIDGAVTEDVAFTIKDGLGNVTVPDNAIIQTNSIILDVTTAGRTACTGTVAIGAVALYTGSLASTGLKTVTAPTTKLTADSELTITITDNIPTNSMSVSVYIPYVLGN
jgi:hypothetical protein